MNRDWKFWTLIIFIGLGLSFEVMKKVNFGTHGLNTQIRPGEWMTERVKWETSHDLVDKSQIKTPELPLLKSYAVAENSKIIAANSTPDVKKEDAKKPDTKKKKKKKKKEEEKTTSTDGTPYNPPQDLVNTNRNQPIDSQVTPSPALTMVPKANSPEAKDNPQPLSLGEWQQLLLGGSPNYSNVVLFIRNYQSNLVPNDIFDEIVSEMMADSRDKIKEYGLIILGTNPSEKNFTLLVHFSQAFPQNSYLGKLSAHYINFYADIRYLTLLSHVLSDSQYAVGQAEAARLVAASANQYIKSNSQIVPAGGQVSGSHPTTLQQNHTAQYQSLLPILANLERQGETSLIKNSARDAFNIIKSLLG